MAEEKQKNGNKVGEISRNLPRNYRQIGEPGTKKIYMEDYVYTYLNKLAQPDNLYARGAILFGKMYKTSIGKCMFISGAAACQNFELDLEETIFSEESWTDIYRIRDSFFSDLEICGWFLSRMGFSVDLNDKIIRIHMDNFSGEDKVLYMIDALENEDAFYQFENYSLKKQRGYYIYYETNQEMKDYMLAEGEMGRMPEKGRVSNTLKRDTAVVKNYKKVLKEKKKLHKKSIFQNPVYMVGSVTAVMLLIYGVHFMIQFQNNQKTQSVFRQQEVTDAAGLEDTTSTQLSLSGQEKNNGQEMTTGKETTATGTKSSLEQSAKDQELTEEETDTEESKETWNSISGYYTVKRGDTLAGISKKMYQSYDYIEAIAEANGIENVDEIYPGQILEIPQIED